jgi:hypothetical protein
MPHTDSIQLQVTLRDRSVAVLAVMGRLCVGKRVKCLNLIGWDVNVSERIQNFVEGEMGGQDIIRPLWARGTAVRWLSGDRVPESPV